MPWMFTELMIMKLFFSRELDTFRKERARIRKENEEKKIKELV